MITVIGSAKTAGPELAQVRLVGDALRRFRLQQLDGVYAHVANAAVISSILATALAVYLTPAFSPLVTHWWLAAKIGISAVRLGVAVLYKKSSGFAGRDQFAKQLMLVLLAIDGAVWGAAGSWTVYGSSETACLVSAVLASVALMAASGLGTMAAAGACFNVPMLASAATALAFRGDAIGFFGSAGIMLVLLQSLVTGRVSERRLRSEFLAHEATADALAAAARNGQALEAALLEVRRQSAVKALFLGTMSHELRTPLHGILGLTQLVLQRSNDPVVRHRLGLVESSGNHLLELIGALLDISRIDSGRLELHVTPFDLAAELRNIADLYQLRCEAKGLRFDALIEMEDACMVLGDAARLRQVLHNLLGNAVKFTKSGVIILRVRRTDDHFAFEVRDTGLGISPKDHDRIFEAFHQVDESATRPADGTGLGLSIAREVVRALGGDIAVSSAVGVGSRFEFTATLPAAPMPAEKSTQTRGGDLPRLRTGYRVLLVEDNEVNALIAVANLQNLGADVIRASDGKEAVSLAFGSTRPEFILMDCRMPLMDGPTATREIRKVEKLTRLQPVPIVALTASPDDEDRRVCIDAGMDGMLMKPFSSEQLLQTIALYAAGDVCNKDHPLFALAESLEDMEPDTLGGPGIH